MLAIEGANKDEAKKNLEKFQNEEKKLLRMLDQLMRQYDNVENKIQQNGWVFECIDLYLLNDYFIRFF